MVTEPHIEAQRPWLMRLARANPGLAVLPPLALVGLGISIYLTVVHYDSKVSLVCTSGGVINCQQVTSSAYSVVPGTTLPITIPGMLWFLALGGLALVALRAAAQRRPEPERLRVAMLLWCAVGLLFVLYLVFVEIVKIQRICEWCTVIHLLTLTAFVIALQRWQHRDDFAPVAQTRAPQAIRASHRSAPLDPMTRAHTQAALSRRARRGGHGQRAPRGR